MPIKSNVLYLPEILFSNIPLVLIKERKNTNLYKYNCKSREQFLPKDNS